MGYIIQHNNHHCQAFSDLLLALLWATVFDSFLTPQAGWASSAFCSVFFRNRGYNRMTGNEGERIAQELPEEQKKYGTILRNRISR